MTDLRIILDSTAWFRGREFHIGFTSYTNNGRAALLLVNPLDSEDYIVASVNIPEAELAPGEILIKNWSENAGVLEALVENRVVCDTGARVATGYVYANVCRLLDPYRTDVSIREGESLERARMQARTTLAAMFGLMTDEVRRRISELIGPPPKPDENDE